jgi:hypothetical protein
MSHGSITPCDIGTVLQLVTSTVLRFCMHSGRLTECNIYKPTLRVALAGNVHVTRACYLLTKLYPTLQQRLPCPAHPPSTLSRLYKFHGTVHMTMRLCLERDHPSDSNNAS